jgi:hypothetical protein
LEQLPVIPGGNTRVGSHRKPAAIHVPLFTAAIRASIDGFGRLD